MNGNEWRTRTNTDLTYWLSTKDELGKSSIVNDFVAVGYPTAVVIGKDYKVVQLAVGGSVSTATIRKAISDMQNGNTPPVSDAGTDQDVDEKTRVTLDGSGSRDDDPGDSITSYSWTQTSGTAVTLSGSNGIYPSFTAPVVGANGESLRFELTVEDTNGADNTDSCTVRVLNTGNPPISDAGADQTVDENVTITLDGSGSRDDDPGDSIISYSWVQTSGTAVTLSNNTVERPTFTSPVVGTNGEMLKFELTVEDTNGETDTDTCIVNINYNSPVPDAGSDQTVVERDVVTLNGSNSECYDPAETITAYVWEQKSGAVTVTLSDKNAMNPVFTAPDVGADGVTLEFDLTITCNGREASDTCIVHVTNGENKPPVAKADRSPNTDVHENIRIKLTGEQSTDPDGESDIESYFWIQTSGTSVSLSCTSCVEAEFTTPVIDTLSEELTFILTVTDKGNLSSKDSCSVKVFTGDNFPPVANAGFTVEYKEPSSAITASPNETLILSGELSYDPDGTDDMVSYQWEQTAGTPVALSCTDCLKAEFITPDTDSEYERLTFRLTVTDKGNLQSESTCNVQVIGQDEAWGCFIDSLGSDSGF